MARAVPPWLHRVCIRNHGPADPWLKLMLFTLNSFMDDSGESYQGQEALAKAAAMGISTVREKMAIASKEGWIALYPRGRQGQKWKTYTYRACVPDWIDLSQITVKDSNGEKLADHHENVHGGIDDDAVSGSRYPQLGKRRAPPVPGGPSGTQNGEAPPAEHVKHRQLVAEAPPAEVEKDRQPVRGKSSSESSHRSYKRKGAAEDRSTPVFFDKGESRKEEPERQHIPFPDIQAMAKEVFQGRGNPMNKPSANDAPFTDEELSRKIQMLRGITDEAGIIKILKRGASEQRIRTMYERGNIP